MRIMAIDYGDAHTGIAISDPTGLLAGFTTVINSRRQEVVVEQVTLLAKEHGAEELVLGHPVNMDGTLGPRSEKTKAMKVLLEEAGLLPGSRSILFWWDWQGRDASEVVYGRYRYHIVGDAVLSMDEGYVRECRTDP